jgi:hypothetical protein
LAQRDSRATDSHSGEISGDALIFFKPSRLFDNRMTQLVRRLWVMRSGNCILCNAESDLVENSVGIKMITVGVSVPTLTAAFGSQQAMLELHFEKQRGGRILEPFPPAWQK